MMPSLSALWPAIVTSALVVVPPLLLALLFFDRPMPLVLPVLVWIGVYLGVDPLARWLLQTPVDSTDATASQWAESTLYILANGLVAAIVLTVILSWRFGFNYNWKQIAGGFLINAYVWFSIWWALGVGLSRKA